jgi:hypothetical protein
MSEKKRRDVLFIRLSPLGLKSPASTVWAVGFTMVRGMHEAMVTNVLRAVEIKVALISTISTMKQLQCRGSEC